MKCDDVKMKECIKLDFKTVQDIDEDAGVQAVHEAFRLGINFFDTSPFYGSTKSETVAPPLLIRKDSMAVRTKYNELIR